MQLFCLIVLALVITFVNGRAAPIQSQECTFTKSKQHSCLYFVIREDKDHAEAADYCFSEFNGGLPGIYESYEEAEEVMKRYFWWSKSNMSIPRFRFGATRRYPRLPYIYDYTYYNPLDHDGVAVDMDICIDFLTFVAL
uniref:C-type lectin domain-containing protein n=1 Tax=Panagrolaimus superbus TaxID=310955 RepID=A0A914XXP5_9BILA